MPKVKEKSYTRKRASQQTKAIFENFGHPCCQETTAPGLTNVEQQNATCMPAAHNHIVCSGDSSSVSVVGSSEPSSSEFRNVERLPVSQGRDTAATQRTGTPEAAETESSDGEQSENSLHYLSLANGDNPHSEPTFSGYLDTEPVAESGDMAAALRSWALNENIPQVALTSCFNILKSRSFDTAFLPSDARTLLGTPRDTLRSSAVTAMPPGEYCHSGLEYQLRNVLSCASHEGRSVSLSFNIDGLPISKSSKMQLWPIQCIVVEHGNKATPFVVGVSAGPSKPASANDFLTPLVGELRQLMSHGMNFKGQTITVSVKGFVCDAQARSFVYNVKGHMGYSGCPKCVAEGTYSNNSVVYPSGISTLRTDDSFRRQTDPDHHHGVSVLTLLPIDCVRSALLDYMHLLCLGVTKKLLSLWLGGPLDVRLGSAECGRLSE
ncbi:unnamed protein product, partial [Ixodes pacificus]